MGIKQILKTRHSKAFSIIEVLAVVAIMALAMGLAIGGFRLGATRVKESANQLTRDIQATYFNAVKKGKIYRMRFEIGSPFYFIEYLELSSLLPPSEEDEEAFKAWTEREEEKQRELESLSPQERRELTRLDRGEFVLVKKREMNDPVYLLLFSKLNEPEQSDSSKGELFIFFYPAGELDFARLEIGDDGGNSFSLVTQPLTGRVKAVRGRLEEDQWKNTWIED